MYGTILDAGRILGQIQTDSLISGPLAPGTSKTYTFKCTQFGTTWYHSHHSSQYGDGVFGGIIINGPATANYDVDLGTYLVNDFYYKTASQLSDIINSNLQNRQGPPPADTILINGTNKNANGGGSYGKVSMTAGKKYLLRIVNPSLDNMIRLSLDNHSFSVVTADLVPIHPYNTNWLLLGIGDSLMIYSFKTY
jgi:FtsP/CotA-like multicopper oxidase with cupredoxin domain